MIKAPNTNQIKIKLNEQIVGTLAITEEGLAAFEYRADFLQNGFSISPFYLPLKPGVFIAHREPFNGLFGVFNDSLPDGWGTLLTDRMLKEKGYKPYEINALQRLALVGTTGNGALTYHPDWILSNDKRSIKLVQIAKEVSQILQQEESPQLDTLYQMAGSSGGAHPKVTMRIDGEEWIIKFPAASDPQNIGEIEYQYSLAAKKCGIEMTETRLFEGKYFGIRRFDRKENKRIHVHSASGLLYASHRFPSLDYTELIKATLALTKNMNEALKIFRQMVFNVLTSNKDDHAKNFSFIYQNDEWKISPAYDLVLSQGFNGQHTTTIAGKGNPEKEDFFEVAKLTGLPTQKANKIYDEVFEGTQSLKKTYKL
jgi:serine/threonine-protein kinase HipA